MALNQYARTQLLVGEDGIARLQASRIAVFGIGGVGGYCCDALVRSGVMKIDLFDDDRVCLTNLNRQLIALRSTVGKHKVDVMTERLLDINPDVQINAHKMFYLPENADEVDLTQYDYVVDVSCCAHTLQQPSSSMSKTKRYADRAWRSVCIFM